MQASVKKLPKEVLLVYDMAITGNDGLIRAKKRPGRLFATARPEFGACGEAWCVLGFWEKAEIRPKPLIVEIELNAGQKIVDKKKIE